MTKKETNLYRLNRAVAKSGLYSRRQADELIKTGQVRINGRKIQDFNYLVNLEEDKLEINGNPVVEKPLAYILLNKPKGLITTCKDERGRKSVLDLLPSDLQHLLPVGRLDMDSEGMLILTNDGALAQRLTHPSHHVLKLYEVTVSGTIAQSTLGILETGVILSDGPATATNVQLLECTNHLSRFQVALSEGRNRQVRRMCAKLGYPVIRLVRVAIGELQLTGLESGHWRHLTATEVATLRSGW